MVFNLKRPQQELSGYLLMYQARKSILCFPISHNPLCLHLKFCMHYSLQVKIDHHAVNFPIQSIGKKTEIIGASTEFKPPRYWCDALLTELWSHTLGARSIYWVRIFPWSEMILYEIIHIWTRVVDERTIHCQLWNALGRSYSQTRWIMGKRKIENVG